MSIIRIENKGRKALTKKEREELEKAKSSTIDLTDIPEINPDEWKGATRGKFYKPLKEGVYIRLDADVLAWQRNKGTGYQTRINNILRNAMLRELRHV